jgi:hypothetical protein
MATYRYEPSANGCFIVRAAGERLGWVLPSGTGFRAHDTFMVPVRGSFKTRKAAADALMRAFERAKERGDL